MWQHSRKSIFGKSHWYQSRPLTSQGTRWARQNGAGHNDENKENHRQRFVDNKYRLDISPSILVCAIFTLWLFSLFFPFFLSSPFTILGLLRSCSICIISSAFDLSLSNEISPSILVTLPRFLPLLFVAVLLFFFSFFFLEIPSYSSIIVSFHVLAIISSATVCVLNLIFSERVPASTERPSLKTSSVSYSYFVLYSSSFSEGMTSFALFSFFFL